MINHNTMQTEIYLRPANSKDAYQILQIMNDAILNSTAIYDYQPRDAHYVSNWLVQQLKDHMPVIVAVQDGKCIGYGSYARFRPKDGYLYCVEHSIYVSQGSRGSGVGKRLLQVLVAGATQCGFHTMIAGIDADNKKSIQFHEKAGFIQAGYLKEVGFKFDRWLDLVFMQLTLGQKDPASTSQKEESAASV